MISAARQNLPFAWEKSPLRMLLETLESGSRPKGGVKNIESGVPSIGGEHLDSNGGFRLDRTKFVPTEFARQMNRGHIQKGDILVVKDGATTGKTSLVRDSFPFGVAVANEHVFVCRCKEGINPRYIFYYLFSAHGHSQILQDFRGAAQGGISQRFADLVQVPLAPLNQQDRIVEEIEKQFSRLDEAVANLKRIKANLKRYKAAVLKAAVEGKLTEAWRKAHPDVEPATKLLDRILTERREKWNGKGKYKESGSPDLKTLPKLPDKWVWAPLNAIAGLKGGITVDKNRKSATARPVPYLRVANVQRGYLDLSEVKIIEAPDADIKDLNLLPGDILFNEGGDRDKLGRGWIWEGQLPECIHQNHVFRARLYLAEVAPKLISWWGNSFGQSYFLREGKQTTNLASLNLTKLSAFPIPLPSAFEQKEIVAEVERRLSVIDELEATVSANLTRANRLRQSVLQTAFSGKLTGPISVSGDKIA